MEVLSPAGSFDSLVMAVQNGADAVYAGGNMFSARTAAKNFDNDTLIHAVDYCHLRGVKLYLAVNTLIKETELDTLYQYLSFVHSIGVDAIIVQDLSVLRAMGNYLPDLPIHASTQMTIHNTDGVRQLEQIGAKRVVLSRELSKHDIAHIKKHTGAELEVFVHGALCICYSGQCLMSSMIGGRSGNRGACAQPCRLPYTLYDGDKKLTEHLTLISPKDLCLADRLEELKNIGVHSLKIEGRMKSPEYVGMVTRVYKEATKHGADQKDIDEMLRFFSRGGSSYGYFDGNLYDKMMDYGEKSKISADKQATKDIRMTVNEENKTSPLSLFFSARANKPLSLTAVTENGLIAYKEGGNAQIAIKTATTKERIVEQLSKLGGTVFRAEHIEVEIEDALAISIKEMNELRRQAIAELETTICESYRREKNIIPYHKVQAREKRGPILTAQVNTIEQAKVAQKMGIERIFLPLSEYRKWKNPNAVAVLPPVIKDNEKIDLNNINKIMIENIGQLKTAKGKEIYGGHRLNVFNSQTAQVLYEQGAKSITLSPELNLGELSALTGGSNMPFEVVGYGRLPLMYMENCIIKSSTKCECNGKVYTLKDRKGERFPLLTEHCRNIILNSKPIYMADKLLDIKNLQIDSIRLIFTVENPDLCCIIIEEYQKALRNEHLENHIEDYTRGHYYRGTV